MALEECIFASLSADILVWFWVEKKKKTLHCFNPLRILKNILVVTFWILGVFSADYFEQTRICYFFFSPVLLI